MSPTLRNMAKWAWLAAVLAAAGIYLSRHLTDTSDYLGALEPAQVFASIVLLIAGKILLSEAARCALSDSATRPSLPTMFRFYSIAQLGKYLPGGIWHFVGRAVLYRSAGIELKAGSRAIALETAWLLTSAASVGVALSLPSLAAMAQLPLNRAVQLAALVLLAGLWVAALALEARLLGGAVRPYRIPYVALCQLALWSAIGISFWCLLPGPERAGTLGLAAGGFGLAWVSGYVVPFAPAGIGVREAVLAAILAGKLSVPQAALAAGFSRVVWVVTEVILGLGSQAMGNRTTPSGLSGTEQEVESC